jgi:hypothetical protein
MTPCGLTRSSFAEELRHTEPGTFAPTIRAPLAGNPDVLTVGFVTQVEGDP